MSKEKKEAARKCKTLRQSISDCEATLNRLLKEYKSVCCILSANLDAYNKASVRFAKKDTAKTRGYKESASALLVMAYGEYKRSNDGIIACRADIIERYDRLVRTAADVGDREWNKAQIDRETFVHESEIKLKRADKGIGDCLPDFLTGAEIEAEPNSERELKPESDRAVGAVPLNTDFLLDDQPGNNSGNQPGREQSAQTARNFGTGVGAGTVGVTSVNIAPINIDISDVVSRAVSATVAKLSARLDGKLSEYADSLVIPTPAVNSAPEAVPAGADGERLLALAKEEAASFAELKKITEALGELNSKIQELNEACRIAAEAQRQLADEQKRIAEAQREASDEQKRVAEAQRETGAMLTEITEAQRSTYEGQLKIALDQKQVAEMQKKTIRLQQGIRISQKLLDEETSSESPLVKKKETTESE